MARIRTIKPEFWEDEVIGCLSRDARLLFIATWNLADDEGRLRWSAPYLKASAFIFDDDVTVVDVECMMDSLVAAGLVLEYRAGKAMQRLGLVVNFTKHQNINRALPSKLPPPPDSLTESLTESLAESLTEPVPSDSLAEVEGEGEVEGEVERKIQSPTGDSSKPLPAVVDQHEPKAALARHMADIWNDICGDILPRARGDPPKTRQQHMLARYAELGRSMDRWEHVCRRVRASDFLTGQAAVRNGRAPFRASLDWVLTPNNFVKVVEGNYDNRGHPGRESIDEWAARLAQEHGQHGGH